MTRFTGNFLRLPSAAARWAGILAMTRVAVLYGGISAEREVSLSTGTQVILALREAGFEVTAIEVGEDLGAVIAALSPRAGRGVQRIARPLRRGWRDPGRARLARNPLHAFRRARLRAGNGQGRSQGGVRRGRTADRAWPRRADR